MGVIKQGILGGFSGKVGGVVGSVWKGIAYMKALPQSVANPRTAPQVAQRTKFANVIAFSKIILATIIKPLFDRFASGESGYNVFTRLNIPLFAGALPSTFANLVISQGKMAATAIATLVALKEGMAVTVTWADDAGEGFKLGTDEVYVVIINETSGETVGLASPETRGSLEAEVSFTANMAENDIIHAYLGFRRADGTVVSNNSYKTELSA